MLSMFLNNHRNCIIIKDDALADVLQNSNMEEFQNLLANIDNLISNDDELNTNSESKPRQYDISRSRLIESRVYLNVWRFLDVLICLI